MNFCKVVTILYRIQVFLFSPGMNRFYKPAEEAEDT